MLLRAIKSKMGTLERMLHNYRVRKGYYSKKGVNDFFIVMYHGIDQVQHTQYNPRFFSRDNFESQIAFFSKHVHILTHEDIMLGRRSATKPNMLITFDDGYRNNLTYAVPVLEKYNTHAYFFVTGMATQSPALLWADALDIVTKHAPQGSKLRVSGVDFVLCDGAFVQPGAGPDLITMIVDSRHTGYVQKQELIDGFLSLYDFTKQPGMEDYWVLMTDEEIRKASQSSCVTIGSHGYYHNNLGSLANEDAVAEVAKSREYLQNIIQKEVNTIGFPDGSYTPQLNQSLYDTGFKAQFVVNYRFGDAGDKEYVYDRIGLYPYMGNEYELLYKMLR